MRLALLALAALVLTGCAGMKLGAGYNGSLPNWKLLLSADLKSETDPMVKSFIRGLSRWPSTDLAEIVIAIQRILHERAEHQAEAKRPKGRSVAGRPAK